MSLDCSPILQGILGRYILKIRYLRQCMKRMKGNTIHNIIYCLIRSLRKKLEPDPRHPRYIHTVRGVGYKFEVISGE